MGYTAMQGGLSAIEAAERLSFEAGLTADGTPLAPVLISEGLGLAVDRVMSEGGLYDPSAASVALVQAQGDLHEASFIVRAYRSTLPRIAYSLPVDTGEMRVERRITPAFQTAPGGQLLGATRDYSQRLLDWRIHERSAAVGQEVAATDPPAFPRIASLLRAEGLLAEPSAGDTSPADITRDPITFPASRSAKLQTLARGETGAMVALGYSTMRGYGAFAHGTIAELRVGTVALRMRHPYTGEPATIGHVRVTEVEEFTVSPHRKVSEVETFHLGYGLVFGRNERKAIAMAMLDRHLAEGHGGPASDEEFILMHIDGVEATGFVEHLKLPHYVEFQSILQGMRRRRDRDDVSAGKEFVHA